MAPDMVPDMAPDMVPDMAPDMAPGRYYERLVPNFAVLLSSLPARPFVW